MKHQIVSFDQTVNRMLGLYVKNSYLKPYLLILHVQNSLTCYLIVTVVRPAFCLSAFVKSRTAFSIAETEAFGVASTGLAGFSGAGAGAGAGAGCFRSWFSFWCWF